MREQYIGEPRENGLNLKNVRFGQLHTVEERPAEFTSGPRKSRTKYRGENSTALFDRLEIAVDRTTGCMAFVGVVRERARYGSRMTTHRYILDQNFDPLHMLPVRGINALTPQSAQASSDESPSQRVMITQEEFDLNPPKVETRVDIIDAKLYFDSREGDSAADLVKFVESIGFNLQRSPQLALEYAYVETTPERAQEEPPERVMTELNENFRLLPVKRDDLGRLIPDGTNKYGPAYDAISVRVDPETGIVGIIGRRDSREYVVNAAYEPISSQIESTQEIIGFSDEGVLVRNANGAIVAMSGSRIYEPVEEIDRYRSLRLIVEVTEGHDLTGDKIAELVREMGIPEPQLALLPPIDNESPQEAPQQAAVSLVKQPAPSQKEVAPISPIEDRKTLIHALQFALSDPPHDSEQLGDREKIIEGLITALTTRFDVTTDELTKIVDTETLEAPRSMIERAGEVVELLRGEQREDAQQIPPPGGFAKDPEITGRVGDTAVVPHADLVATYLHRKAAGSAKFGDRVRVATTDGPQDYRDPLMVYGAQTATSRLSRLRSAPSSHPLTVEQIGEERIVTRQRPQPAPEVEAEPLERPHRVVERVLHSIVGVDYLDIPGSEDADTDTPQELSATEASDELLLADDDVVITGTGDSDSGVVFGDPEQGDKDQPLQYKPREREEFGE